MNIIKTYLVACRSFISSTILNGFLMGTITSMVHSGSLNLTKSMIVCIICFQTHNFVYLINSYIDFLNQVDDKVTAVDRTLFDVITVNHLKGYLKFILISIISLLTLTFYWYGYKESLTFFYFVLFHLLCGFTYTQSKYVGLGYLPFIYYHVSVYWFFYYSHSGYLPLTGPPFYYSFLIAFGMGNCLSGNYVRDYEDDKKAGIITLATYFGKNRAIQIIKFFIFLFVSFINNIH
ncbi:hypothetical protein CYY_008888 [Polysphondylium violaceum]|uniref:UbiA prenyltransferase family protein n=1 Tax=Polysphondylium violaceum TaxID=133409 RepID=A0A8J4UWU2_9MYCE|nr:hypothetical protein CYY_008888 [Polysphondylium violaceum]